MKIRCLTGVALFYFFLFSSLMAETLFFDLMDATPDQAYAKAGGSLYVTVQPRLGTQEYRPRTFCVGHTRGEEYRFGARVAVSFEEDVCDARQLLMGVHFHHRKVATGNPAFMVVAREPENSVDRYFIIKVTSFEPGTGNGAGTVKAEIKGPE